MIDVKFSQAANAYGNATKIGGLADGMMPVEDDGLKAPAFSELLGHALDKARDAGYTSEATSLKSIAGQTELHDLVLAVNNAELTLNTVVALRDRVVSAYQDIIKMPI